VTDQPTDIDELMDRDPTQLSKQDITAIITYHRRQRTNRAKGAKVSADLAAGKTDLMTALGIKASPSVEIKRRF
jgi:hypothetical protein